MWLLTSFWRTLVAAIVLLGLFYIPSDVKGLPNALRVPLGFLVTYKEALILLYALALTLWIAWRDARPHLKPRIVTALGRPSRFKLIGELDDYLAEGVALRNMSCRMNQSTWLLRARNFATGMPQLLNCSAISACGTDHIFEPSIGSKVNTQRARLLIQREATWK